MVKILWLCFLCGHNVVFLFQTLWQYSDGDPLTVAQIAIFDFWGRWRWSVEWGQQFLPCSNL